MDLLYQPPSEDILRQAIIAAELQEQQILQPTADVRSLPPPAPPPKKKPLRRLAPKTASAAPVTIPPISFSLSEPTHRLILLFRNAETPYCMPFVAVDAATNAPWTDLYKPVFKTPSEFQSLSTKYPYPLQFPQILNILKEMKIAELPFSNNNYIVGTDYGRLADSVPGMTAEQTAEMNNFYNDFDQRMRSYQAVIQKEEKRLLGNHRSRLPKSRNKKKNGSLLTVAPSIFGGGHVPTIIPPPPLPVPWSAPQQQQQTSHYQPAPPQPPVAEETDVPLEQPVCYPPQPAAAHYHDPPQQPPSRKRPRKKKKKPILDMPNVSAPVVDEPAVTPPRKRPRKNKEPKKRKAPRHCVTDDDDDDPDGLVIDANFFPTNLSDDSD